MSPQFNTVRKVIRTCFFNVFCFFQNPYLDIPKLNYAQTISNKCGS